MKVLHIRAFRQLVNYIFLFYLPYTHSQNQPTNIILFNSIFVELLKNYAILFSEMETEPTVLMQIVDFIIGSLIVIIGMGISLLVLAFFNGLFDPKRKSPETDVFISHS